MVKQVHVYMCCLQYIELKCIIMLSKCIICNYTQLFLNNVYARLTDLSLRNSHIGDEGARLIGSSLSTVPTANKKLLSLNLAFNSIGDAGANHIAQVCRIEVCPSEGVRRLHTLKIECLLSPIPLSKGSASQPFLAMSVLIPQSNRGWRSSSFGWGTHTVWTYINNYISFALLCLIWDIRLWNMHISMKLFLISFFRCLAPLLWLMRR